MNYNKAQISLFVIISLILILGSIFIINNFFEDKNNININNKIKFENSNQKSIYVEKDYLVECLKIKSYESINRVLIQGGYYKNKSFNETSNIQNLIYLDFSKKEYFNTKLNKSEILNYFTNYIKDTIPSCIEKNNKIKIYNLNINYEKFGDNLNFIVDSNIFISYNISKEKNQIKKINFRINNFPLDKIYSDYSNISNLIVAMGENYHNLKKYKNLSLKYQNLINKINLGNKTYISIKKNQINKIKYLYYNLTYFNNERNYTFYFSIKDSTLKSENQ